MNKNAIELYTEKAFGTILKLAPGVALLAGLFFSFAKLFGWYPDVSMTWLIVFDASCALYLLLGIHYINTSFDDNGNLMQTKLDTAKMLLIVLTLVQWNFISYLIPSVDFWGYAPLFLLLSAFFLDSKMVGIEAIGLFVSILVSWVLKGHALTSPDDGFYLPNMMLRLLCLILTLASVYLITRFSSGLLLHQAELLADYDPLTRLLNRRRMDEYIANAHMEVKQGKSYTLALMDIDDFKPVNDTYGHEFGDIVLMRVAAIISRCAENKAEVFRYGGEEFLLLFTDHACEAGKICDEILKTVSHEVFSPLPGVNFSISLTAGIAVYRNGERAQDTVHRADMNMYEGKNQGKNRIVSD